MTSRKNLYTISRKAFTMLELVFVIVVLGILASLAMTGQSRDLRQEAADHVLSMIRYTQHLAVNDNMHMNNLTWQQKYWRIVFSNGAAPTTTQFYMIGSDRNMGNVNNAFFAINEAATDPSNGLLLFGTANIANAGNGAGISSNIFLSQNYGITAVTSGGGCAGNGGRSIGFDHLGRPHYGFEASAAPNQASYMSNVCTFTFTMSDGATFDIDIQPETGFAMIRGQLGS